MRNSASSLQVQPSIQDEKEGHLIPNDLQFWVSSYVGHLKGPDWEILLEVNEVTVLTLWKMHFAGLAAVQNFFPDTTRSK